MSGRRHQLQVVLDDLASRFFLNLPAAELDSFERLFFQLEQAWWFYDDFHREARPETLPRLGFRDFCLSLFEHSSALRPHIPNFDLHFGEFRAYLAKVPVCGAVLLDPTWTSCVLVRGFRSRSWSFPKGKINQGERPIDCAIREVLEETGLDITALVSERHVLQAVVNGKCTNLFVAPGVAADAAFATQTRKEIADIRWFRIDALDAADPNRFWSVAPFLYKLRTWIARHRHLRPRRPQRRAAAPPPPPPLVSDTFGDDLGDATWPAEEMFAVNARLFGVESTSVSDANQLAALMADRKAMAGTVQWRLATDALKRQPLPPPAPPDIVRLPTTATTTTTTTTTTPKTPNALLSFDLDDAVIMSHFA